MNRHTPKHNAKVQAGLRKMLRDALPHRTERKILDRDEAIKHGAHIGPSWREEGQ